MSKVKKVQVRSNGLRMEVREISEPVMVFTSDPANRYPLPIYDEILDADYAKEIVRRVMRDSRFVRKV